MTDIFWPETQVTEVISGILTAVGRVIRINIKVDGIPCPACSVSGYLDPVTNTSTNSFCGLCEGLYYLDTISGLLVSGHVKWLISEIPRWYPGGQIPDGDCMLTLAYSDALRTQIERAKNFEVDGKKLTLKNYKLRGVKQPNRIIVVLQEEAN